MFSPFLSLNQDRFSSKKCNHLWLLGELKNTEFNPLNRGGASEGAWSLGVDQGTRKSSKYNELKLREMTSSSLSAGFSNNSEEDFIIHINTLISEITQAKRPSVTEGVKEVNTPEL